MTSPTAAPGPTTVPAATAAGYMPSTFLERGVAVPFTTPQLTGARARPGERDPLELLVPNPSGADGVYILPWHAIGALCRPTVHDSRLNAMVSAQPAITPASIRAAVRQVAVEGLAGREARAAAQTAQADEEQACLLTNFDLLLELLRQREPPDAAAAPLSLDRPELLQARAQAVVGLLAPELGRTAEQLGAGLEELARLYSGIGVGLHARSARLPVAIAGLVQFRREVAEHAAAHGDAPAEAVALMLESADLTLFCSRTTLEDAQGLAGDMTALLRRWGHDRDGLGRELARPDWLLDGWTRVCALWQRTQPAKRSAALPELTLLVPTVPREAGEWLAHRLDTGVGQVRNRRRVGMMQDWRTGACVPDLVARNEELLVDTL